MESDKPIGKADQNVVHLNAGERLPAVPASSQAAEVLKQIIEQILANERKRARLDFIRTGSIFLVFLFVMLVTGIWFARQLLTQLREERRITEQTWRMMAGGIRDMQSIQFPSNPDSSGLLETAPQGGQPAGKQAYLAAQNREDVAKLEQNIKDMSELLKNKPQNVSDEVRKKLQKQQTEIEALNIRLNEEPSSDATVAAGKKEQSPQTDFLAVTAADGLKLRMPIPSL